MRFNNELARLIREELKGSEVTWVRMAPAFMDKCEIDVKLPDGREARMTISDYRITKDAESGEQISLPNDRVSKTCDGSLQALRKLEQERKNDD